ncbi:MAG: hypothetical protein LIP01_15670 [Tannerellaceae bacterium]|nr:hypothetical protein [Tannerellaceae bacterium]
MINIYDKTGKEIVQVPVTTESVRKHDLMGENYLLLVFELPEYISFPKGCHTLYQEERFEVMQNVYPEQDNKKRGWKYEIYFEPKEGLLKKYNLFYRTPGVEEVAFSLTTNLLAHATLVADCMNHELGGMNWVVKDVPEEYREQSKQISYQGEKLFDALNLIAGTFDCEWWTEQNGDLIYICLGKLEFGTEEPLEVGKAVASIPRRKGDASNYGTRFFVYGSGRNLTADYKPIEQGGVTNHIAEVRLHLPDNIPYIDAWDNLAPEEVVHQVAFFEDIYILKIRKPLPV